MNQRTGTVAIVTGASRGIGRAAAIRLAQLGANVVVNYLTSAEQADQVVTEIRAAGADAIAVRADTRRRQRSVVSPSRMAQVFQISLHTPVGTVKSARLLDEEQP